MQAVTYWGSSDDGSWLGAPVGLVRRDGSVTPSYEALRDLVKGVWWLSPTKLRTDVAGRVEVSGFLGDYRVSGIDGGEVTFALDVAGQVDIDVTLPFDGR